MGSVQGYGGFFGRIDVDAVDLIKYPKWANVEWWYADLEAGDCLYIPSNWYHQVTATPERSINVHVWYWRPSPKIFNATRCSNPREARGRPYGDPKGKKNKCKLP